MNDLKKIVKEISVDNMKETINWLTQNTPYRLSGSKDSEVAADYVLKEMKEYGLDVYNEEFYTYNSIPKFSDVEITFPIQEKLNSLPCAHSQSTEIDGQELILVYGKNGSIEDYINLDVKGKVVLLEVSYSPPVPEKARIASSLGAAGVILMNWGNDEGVICNRGIKAVWGNPTEETIHEIPKIIAVSITRKSGLKLKELCLKEDRVKVRITSISDQKWSKVYQPRGLLKTPFKSEEFILIGSHLDAWHPGVTCNATGNATTLEICRILSEYREKLRRNIIFVFWNGHEVAEAGGSTWFVDNYWDQIHKNCVAYIHIDSTGVKNTKIYEIKASEELMKFAIDNLSVSPVRTMNLKKIGDQSFMGIGIPSVTQRMSFTEDDILRENGATLGWWNHTNEDTLDKCDFDILRIDTAETVALIYKLAIIDILPYDYSELFDSIKDRIKNLSTKYSDHIDFSEMTKRIVETEELINQIMMIKEEIASEDIDKFNTYLMSISRQIMNVFNTHAVKYQQDSYGFTKLAYPIPLLADLEKLDTLPFDSFEYGLVKTQLIKNRNRINDALKCVIDYSVLYKEVLLNNSNPHERK